MCAAPRQLVRPIVRRLHPYLPGEQPKIPGVIKLNTNENPYPPSPKVLAAVRKAVDGRLRLYPNATAQPLREELARLHHCSPDNIIVGNGSDELLAMAVRAFVEPSKAASKSKRVASRQAAVQFFTPSYSLYPVLADIQGAARISQPLKRDFSIPSLAELSTSRDWDWNAALTFVTTPNAPSGLGYGTATLEALCQALKGVVVLDEAYVDFASENALPLALKHPHVLVARTFSKAYSLCFQRVGYFVGSLDLIEALQKIRDSYNVNGLGQIAAIATLADLPHYRANFSKIIRTRENLGSQLKSLGFEVRPSQTNFILVRPPCLSARDWQLKLRERKILVRWFDQPLIRDHLRITVGTPQEAGVLVEASRTILKDFPSG